MYLNILKKDLKRKKTMNVILLMFITLASMFVSSSVNNITAILGGIDYYYDKAGMTDYFIATVYHGEPQKLSDSLEQIDEVKSLATEDVIWVDLNDVSGDLETMAGSGVLMSYDEAFLTYFDENNQPISKVNKGEILVPLKVMDSEGISKGDKIKIDIDGESKEFTVAGGFKDAILGSGLIGFSRFITNQEDFEKFSNAYDMYGGGLHYVTADDTAAVTEHIAKLDISLLFNGDRDYFQMTYVLDVVIAGALLVVSILLLLTAFVVLKFTIGFTLSEEFREIGVMKAVGIKNFSIRKLYLAKYFALAVIGSAIGFLVGIPFGKIMLDSVSKYMVFENQNSVFLNLICSAAVVAVILLFCYGCTRKIVKFTPLDAIRSGETGERFSRKSSIRLSKGRLNPTLFLALNDIFSSPKRFGIIAVTFMLCLCPVHMIANTANTLKSDEIITSFSMAKSDICINMEHQMEYMQENGEERFSAYLDAIEQTLTENGMPADVFCEVAFKLTAICGENHHNAFIFKGVGTTTDMYKYFEGTPPQNINEIALTKKTAEKLGADIGDTVAISYPKGEKEYIVTALFQSMNNFGEMIRLHEDADVSFKQASGSMAVQIDFTDDPNAEEIMERKERIKNILGSDNVSTCGEYVQQLIGIGDVMDNVKMLVTVLACVITALIAVLMERSFIEKEKGEIALMKAIGFESSTVILQHTLRLGVTALISSVIAAVIAVPLTELAITPIFEMMGAGYGVEYDIRPVEIFLIYPLLSLLVTVLFAFISALYTRTIKANDAFGIE